MKKQIIILSTFLLAAFFTATAQNNSIAFVSKPFSLSKSSTAKLGISNVILKKFKKNFPSVTDEAWQTTPKEYVVTFTLDGIQNWVYLTKKGNCKAQMRYYAQTELPCDVYKQVRSNYYGFSIASVKEITYKGTIAYVISIEDKNMWKVIHVVNGEMEVLEEYSKNNTK